MLSETSEPDEAGPYGAGIREPHTDGRLRDRAAVIATVRRRDASMAAALAVKEPHEARAVPAAASSRGWRALST